MCSSHKSAHQWCFIKLGGRFVWAATGPTRSVSCSLLWSIRCLWEVQKPSQRATSLRRHLGYSDYTHILPVSLEPSSIPILRESLMKTAVLCLILLSLANMARLMRETNFYLFYPSRTGCESSWEEGSLTMSVISCAFQIGDLKNKGLLCGLVCNLQW